MVPQHKCSIAFISALFFHLASTQFNPTILQDSRDLPKVDGTFGFLYRTEDGIAHAAKGDPDGVIHGRFSYTDPTGLKVNFNYNAGSRVAPGYNYKEDPAPVRPRYQPLPEQEEYSEPQQPRDASPVQYEGPRYVAPQSKYAPQTRSQPQPQPESNYVPQTRPQQRRTRVYSSRYREPVESYQPRTRPPYATNNEIYDNYN